MVYVIDGFKIESVKPKPGPHLPWNQPGLEKWAKFNKACAIKLEKLYRGLI